jgi:hypothetical protein
MSPRAGPSRGGTAVVFGVSQLVYDDAAVAGSLTCVFSLQSGAAPPRDIRSGAARGPSVQTIVCVSPNVSELDALEPSPVSVQPAIFATIRVELHQGDSDPGPVIVSDIPTELELRFNFYPTPRVVDFEPKFQYASGTVMTVRGTGFAPTVDAAGNNAGLIPSIVISRIDQSRTGANAPNSNRALHTTQVPSRVVVGVFPGKLSENGTAVIANTSYVRPGFTYDIGVTLNSGSALEDVRDVAFISEAQLAAQPAGAANANTTAEDGQGGAAGDSGSSGGSQLVGFVGFSVRVCDAGTYSVTDTSPCIPCAPGTFQSATGRSSCEECPRTSYSDVSGAINCTVCPTGTETLRSAASLEACTCRPGFYFGTDGVTRNNGSECRPCKVGGECAGGTAAPVPLPGFWSADAEGIFLPCDAGRDACPGGFYGLCGTGYTGNRCGDCDIDYFAFKGECQQCPSDKSARIIIFLVIVVVLTLGAMFFVFDTKRKQALRTFSLAANFAQVLGIVLSMELRWPAQVKRTVAWITLPFNLELDILATDCAFRAGFDGQWALALALPFIFALFLALFWSVLRFRIWYRGAPERRHTRKLTESMGATRGGWAVSPVHLRDPVADAARTAEVVSLKNATINTFCLLVAVIYVVIASSSLKLFDCSRKGDEGAAFLDAVPSQVCYDAWWWSRFPVAVFFTIVYAAGTPLLIWRLMRHGHTTMSRASFLERYGSIAGKYKSHLASWEALVMLRKLTVVLGKVMFTSIPILQAQIALSAIVVSLVLHVHFHPMAHARDNTLETVLLGCSTAVLLAGILLAGADFDPSGARHAVVVAVTIAVIVGACLALVVAAAVELWGTAAARGRDNRSSRAAARLSAAGVLQPAAANALASGIGGQAAAQLLDEWARFWGFVRGFFFVLFFFL